MMSFGGGFFGSLSRSPTIWTWASTTSRILAFGLTLPLVVTRLSEAEAALWYMFMTVAALQIVADMGLSSVFGRFFAYAAAGSQHVGDHGSEHGRRRSDGPNVDLAYEIHVTTRAVYVVVAAVWTVAGAALLAWASPKLLASAGNPATAVAAAGLVVVAVAIRLYGNRFTACLFGLGEFVRWRRAETVVWLVSGVAGASVLLAGGRLLALTFVTFGLMIINVLINAILARGALRRLGLPDGSARTSGDVLKEAVPRAWRSGIGVLMHTGAMHVVTVAVARLESDSVAAGYLLAYNVLRAMDQMAQAPFYTKLPALARYRAQGSMDDFERVARRGMRMSYWTLAGCCTLVGAAAGPFLDAIGSSVTFVDSKIWAVMVAAVFFERVGASHLQCYMTTNRVVLHIANGVAGALVLLLSVVLYPFAGLIGLPLAQLLANSVWFAGYSARRSYSAVPFPAVRFEVSTSLLPGLFMLVVFVLVHVLRAGGRL